MILRENGSLIEWMDRWNGGSFPLVFGFAGLFVRFCLMDGNLYR